MKDSRALALDFKHLGATREDGRIGRVVVRDEIGHGGLGPLLSLVEAIEFPFPLNTYFLIFPSRILSDYHIRVNIFK